MGGEQSGHILSKINNFSGDGILTALQISKFCKKKNINLNDWLESSFEPYPQKLTNINLNFNINKLNSKDKILIDESIKNIQAIYWMEIIFFFFGVENLWNKKFLQIIY